MPRIKKQDNTSKRERIVKLLSQGEPLSATDIADSTYTSTATVYYHLQSLQEDGTVVHLPDLAKYTIRPNLTRDAQPDAPAAQPRHDTGLDTRLDTFIGVPQPNPGHDPVGLIREVIAKQHTLVENLGRSLKKEQDILDILTSTHEKLGKVA